MGRIGLSDFVPKTFASETDSKSLAYPVVFKFSTQLVFGRGVHIVQNSSQLEVLRSEATKRNKTYTLEEALTGMGLSEVTAYGSVYKGELLSLRCLKRTFSEQSALRSALRTSSTVNVNASSMSLKNIYVFGENSGNITNTYVACSKELIAVVKVMFQQSIDYTGPFCADLKSSAQLHFKIMEINSRVCAGMVVFPDIFISTMIPLAFRTRQGQKVKKASSSITAWYSADKNNIYRHIMNKEQKALATGGGVRGGAWVEVEKFDPNGTLDFIIEPVVEAWARNRWDLIVKT